MKYLLNTKIMITILTSLSAYNFRAFNEEYYEQNIIIVAFCANATGTTRGEL
jgi:hypothetical protein